MKQLADEIKIAFKQTISGGLADHKRPSDFNKENLKKGIKSELEHTDDKNIATEISMDHLIEDPKYYHKLEKMEKEGKAKKKTVVHHWSCIAPKKKGLDKKAEVEEEGDISMSILRPLSAAIASVPVTNAITTGALSLVHALDKGLHSSSKENIKVFKEVLKADPKLKGLVLELGKKAKGDSFKKFIRKAQDNLDPSYMPSGKGKIFIPKDIPESSLRHELGHAKIYKRLGKKAVPAARFFRGTLPQVGFIGSLAMLASDDLAEDAWLASAAGLAPTLLDEGFATGLALKDMIKSKGFLKGIAKSRSLFPAYASYLAPLAVAYGASKLLAPEDDK